MHYALGSLSEGVYFPKITNIYNQENSDPS